MSERTSTSLELRQAQAEYLDKMVKKYDLPDRGKAIRILVNYAMEKADQEEAIFTEIRCTDC